MGNRENLGIIFGRTSETKYEATLGGQHNIQVMFVFWRIYSLMFPKSSDSISKSPTVHRCKEIKEIAAADS